MLALAQPETARRRRRALVIAFPSGRTLLGIVPPDSTFADSVLPQSQVSSRAGFRANDWQNIASAVSSGFIPTYSPCSGNPPTLATVSSGLQAAGSKAIALATGPGALITGPAAPFVIMGGAIANLFGAIFGAHAKAVGLEQATLCGAIPAANQLLQQVDQMLQSGQLSAGQASSLLDQVVQKFESGVAPIIKISSSQCNAACVYLRMLRAIVAKRKAVYRDTAAAAPVSSSSVGPTSQTSSSASLLPWAAAAGVLLLLMRGGF